MESLRSIKVACRVISALDSTSLRGVIEGDMLCCEEGVPAQLPAQSMATALKSA